MVDDLFTISTCGYKTTMMNEFINTKTGLKKLQFGASKCIKLHVGKTCNETLCSNLSVGAWNVEVVNDTNSGRCSQAESFAGQEMMKVKEEQMYLGDIIASDGSHKKNIQARKNKGLGIINKIMQIMQSMFFGKYYFEVALVLRSSLLLSSLLLNSEAWVNLTEKDIRGLEQTDEILLSRILDCDANTSNVLKYLELGVYPIKFEIMKRKISFLQYILKQEENSMMYKVFTATCEHPIKNDFVLTCQKYLECLNIKLTFKEIKEMSEYSFKKFVKEQTKEAAFKYLIGLKNKPGKHTKMANLDYSDLCIQEYLLDGNSNTEISKIIFKARGRNLDIKEHKRWKYGDDLCLGCNENIETENELLSCSGFCESNETENADISYSLVFGKSVSEMIKVATVIRKRLKVRQKLLENG